MRSTEEILGPGQLARLTSVSMDTLRHYERKGFLTSRRSSNGYREYREEGVDRVRLIQRALSVGFSLDELARVFEIRSRGGAPCREVRSLAVAKLDSMQRQIQELIDLREHLRALIWEWDERLVGTPDGGKAHLLDTWPEATVPPGQGHPSADPPADRQRSHARPLKNTRRQSGLGDPSSSARPRGRGHA